MSLNYVLDVGHGYQANRDSIEDSKNKQIERRDLSCEKQSILEQKIPIQLKSAVEDQLTPKNYAAIEKLIVPQNNKRKRISNGKSIFNAVKKIKH